MSPPSPQGELACRPPGFWQIHQLASLPGLAEVELLLPADHALAPAVGLFRGRIGRAYYLMLRR
jgi:hypothetical protein